MEDTTDLFLEVTVVTQDLDHSFKCLIHRLLAVATGEQLLKLLAVFTKETRFDQCRVSECFAFDPQRLCAARTASVWSPAHSSRR